jgi:hypothetical protein
MNFHEAVRRHCEAIHRRCNPVPVGNPLRPKLTPFGT